MRPLITYVLFAYNQERFITEAVKSAFAQSYSPLEILILDDCSTDNTFGIIKKIASENNGPHLVKIFRNSRNLGIGGSLSNAIEHLCGEFIVFAAGDDISMPNRTELLFKAWEESGRKAMGVFSSHITISEEGKELGIEGTRGPENDSRLYRRLDGDLFRWLSSSDPMVNGCATAWAPALFKQFGPVRSDMEDMVLCFRALAIGYLYYINQPLVKWRRHGDNSSFLPREVIMSFEERERKLRRGNEMTVAMYDNIIDDIGLLCEEGRISIRYATLLREEARRVSMPHSFERDLMEKDFFSRLLIVLNTAVHGNFKRALKSAPRALPVPFYRALFIIRAKIKYALQKDIPKVN